MRSGPEIVPPETIIKWIKEYNLPKITQAHISPSFRWSMVFNEAMLNYNFLKLAKIEHLRNAVTMAQEAERVQQRSGRQLKITSWYRTPPHNAKAGGKPNSAHLYALAIDAQANGWTNEVFQNWLIKNWKGRIGINNPAFVHFDLWTIPKTFRYY